MLCLSSWVNNDPHQKRARSRLSDFEAASRRNLTSLLMQQSTKRPQIIENSVTAFQVNTQPIQIVDDQLQSTQPS